MFDEKYGLMADVPEESNMATKNPDECIFSFPNLVYREIICAIIVISCLILISVLFNAPLEEMANPTVTPNPAKAPWYFLALQELLVYFDPWIAGVVLPTVILIGLMLLPYIDINREGIGEYTLKKRAPGIFLFLFGYIMWFILIVIGRFLRGPAWNIYWPWESWEVHKVVSGTSQNISQVFHLSSTLPWYLREIPGGILLLLYFIVIPLILFKVKKGFFQLRGRIRSILFLALTMGMFFVPLKIFLRLAFNIKYILVTPWFSI